MDSGELFLAGGRAEQYRLDKFNASSGAFVSQFPQVPSLSFLHQGVAVGHSTGEPEVYVGGDVTGTQEGAVAVFDAAGGLQAVWKGPKPPSEAFGCFECIGTGDVAVDNSPPGLTWAAGDVYVADPEHAVVDVFKSKAGGGEEYVTRLEGPESGVPFSRPTSVAVSAFNGDVLVVDGEGIVDIFKPAAILGRYEFVEQLTQTPDGSFGKVENLTVDGFDGDIYVVDATSNVVDQFNAAGKYLDRLTGTSAGSFSGVQSVAVDPAAPHDVYVGDYDAGENKGFVDVFGPNLVVPDVTVTEVSPVTPTSATLHGTVNPIEGAGKATCEFEYGTSTSYGQRASCEPKHVAEGEVAVPVQSVPVEGLQPDTTYHYRLDATNVADGQTNTGQGPEDLGEFTTPGPGIHSESVANVAPTSATFEATINPHNAPTTYRFEYLTEAAYLENGGSFSGPQPAISVPRPDGAVGSGESDVEVAQHVQVGLSAGAVYHYRVVAVSEIEVAPKEFKVEEFDGEDQTFTTQIAGAFVLPDGREWEMVSPPDKHGANILSFTEGYFAFQAAAAGNAMTYVATAPTESEPQGFSNVMQVLSTRGPEGWDSRDIGIAHNGATGVSFFAEYPFFSNDLSLGVVHPFGVFDPSVSAEASENTPYLRTDYPSGNVNAPCVKSCYRPLVTGKAGFENVPPETVFGGEEEGKCEVRCGPEFLGATSDLSHVVLKSSVALTKTPVDLGLYEWAAGKLQLVSVLPASEDGGAVAGSLGNPEEKAARAGTISNDGSRVIWAATVEVAGKSEKHLYMSDTATGKTKTVRLDSVQSGAGEGESRPVFQIASSDGSKVLFTDTQRLTEDAGAVAGEPDLYECEMVEEAPGELGCRLSDLTPLNAEERADVQAGGPGASQGAVVGASDDGSWVYFVADGVLENGGVPVPGAEHGQPNLYVRHAGATKLVAVLSGTDRPDWAGGSGEIAGISARVSPNGQWLTFMSQRSLTGYDNRDAVSGKPDEEVYLYHAEASAAGPAKLVCASCDPTGARPLGEEFGSVLEEAFLGGNRAWAAETTTSFAAMVPGWTRELYQSRYLSDSGRLFFESHDALVSQDVNGTWDVYEYEPEGVPESEHACTSAVQSGSDVFKPARTVEVEGRGVEEGAGCVGLISSGTSAEPSAFLDASEAGGDVFFLATSRLAPQDFDTSYDVYDAHECTGEAPCLTSPAQPPPCITEASCKPAPSPQPQIFGAGGSATFSGAGNPASPSPAPAVKTKLTRAQKLAKALRLCKKDKKKSKRAYCEKQTRKRLGVSKAKKAGNKRKAQS